MPKISNSMGQPIYFRETKVLYNIFRNYYIRKPDYRIAVVLGINFFLIAKISKLKMA